MAISYLVLEDGSVFEGESFGHKSSAVGEVVFSTGMSGYQEALTDPSSRGTISVMTYPLIGNYGITKDNNQSDRVHSRGLVVREYCKEPSPMYGGTTIDEFLKQNKVPGISGIDTRDLVIKLRTRGTLKGSIIHDKDRIEETIKQLKSMPAASSSNLVEEVSPKKITKHDFGKKISVGILDCGSKNGIFDEMSKRFNVTVFPYNTPADIITESKVKGLLVSNGPGDPSHPEILKTTAKTVSDLSSSMPLFGICLGSQIISVALGGKTYKMKFGHRGSNQPVRFDNKVYVTSQNHGFAVDEDSLKGKDLIANQINVNDGTVEGIKHKNLPIFTSQYHPEASPGPLDTTFLFDIFAGHVKGGRK